jgi:hypothetical protein
MSDDKQQTAVELFIKQLEEKGDIRETPSIRNIQLNIDTADYIELKIQAKEMDKERLTDAYCDGKANGIDISHPLSLTKEISANEWYNQTYGGNNQLCCTPEGQIKRYVNCIGCDRKPLIQGGNK